MLGFALLMYFIPDVHFGEHHDDGGGGKGAGAGIEDGKLNCDAAELEEKSLPPTAVSLLAIALPSLVSP